MSRGEIEYLLKHWDNPRGLKREHILLKRETKGATFLNSDQFIHWALLHISSHPSNPKHAEDLVRHMRIAQGATTLGHRNYTGFDPKLELIRIPHLLRSTHSSKTRLSEITNDITFSSAFKQDYTFFGCKATCYGNLHVIWVSDLFAYLITHSHFLAVRDCLNAWFSSLAYAYQNQRKYPGYNLYEEVSKVISAVLHDIGMYKDDTFDILKSWQPLVIGTILKYMEASPGFLSSMEEVLQKFKDSQLCKIATRKVSDYVECHLALELTGLTKSFGHPEIVMDESVAAWYDKGTVRKENLEEIGELARAAFVLEFSRNFYKKRRRWPNLTFLTGNVDRDNPPPPMVLPTLRLSGPILRDAAT